MTKEDIKTVYDKLFEVLEIKDPALISSRINEIVFSNECKSYIDKYNQFRGSLDYDPLQKSYQFYCADREDKKQDFTPPCIADLLSKITIKHSDKVIMDVCAGIGALTRSVHENWTDKEFICLELDEEIIPILIFIFFAYKINGKIIHTNVLTRENFNQYVIKDGDFVNEMFIQDNKAQAIISNPPYNLKTTPREAFLSNNANYSFVYESLINSDENARLAFVLPNGVLSSNEEKKSRQYLIENNLVEAVIMLPDRMFDITSIAVCILLLNKKKAHDFITIIDHSKVFEFETIKKQGEGTNRIYSKIRNFITDRHIKTISDLITNTQDSDISKRLSKDEIVSGDYSLYSGTYATMDISTPTDDRPIDHIIADLNRVISHKNNVKLTMNETIARDTGMLAALELMQESNEKTKSLNEFLKNQNIPEIQEHKYLQLTKTKGEIKLEQDKSGLSSLMQITIPVWTHQIHFLNKEENRLLAEVRDWLLPRLMNGEIEV